MNQTGAPCDLTGSVADCHKPSFIMRKFNNNPELVKHVTEFREADVIVGADVYISAEDAKGILGLTEMRAAPEDKENHGYESSEQSDNAMRFEMARHILRQIAKAVLYSGGNATSTPDLMNRFKLENLISHKDIGS